MFSLLWFQSVYGLQNDIRTHSPTHTPAPEAKQPTEEELQEQVDSLMKLHFSKKSELMNHLMIDARYQNMLILLLETSWI